MAFNVPSQLRVCNWNVKWNNNDLGFVDKTQPMFKFKLKPIKVGSLGGITLGHRILGLAGSVRCEFLESVLDLWQKLMPWGAAGKWVLSPATVVDIYTYAQPLILHPTDIGAGTLTQDITVLKAVPKGAPKLARSGTGKDILVGEFIYFPDRALLATGVIRYGYKGPLTA
jgi:hypothetical protein